MSLNIVTGAKSFSTLSIGPPQTVFRIKNLNWFMLTWDTVGPQSSISITINNASYEYDLSSKEYTSFNSWTLPSNAIFQPGSANFSTAFNPLSGSQDSEFRLFTAGSPVPDSPIQQPIMPAPMSQAIGCPSDFPSCAMDYQYLKTPSILSIESLPQCVCIDGYFQIAKSSKCAPCPPNYFCTDNQKIRCPPHFPLSNELSKRSTECYANATEQYLNPVGMPNIDIAARGYHLFYGNPHSMTGPDPGLRDLVFDFNSFDGTVSFDQRYVIPFGTSIFEDIACQIDFKSVTISSTEAYKRKLDTKVEVDGSTAGYSFRGSTEYKQVDEGSTSRGSTFTSTEAECSLYNVFIEFGKVRLSQSFASFIRENVIGLSQPAGTTNTIPLLLNRFGTHIPRSVTMGSRYGEVIELLQEHVTKSSKQEIKAQAEARMSGSFSASIKSSFGLTTSSTSDFEKNITTRYTFSVGSVPPSDGSAGTWVAQTISNPAVIAMKGLSLISELLTVFYFPDIPPTVLAAAKTNLEDSIINLCPECNSFLDDYDVCFGGAVVNSINTLTKMVGCPPGYDLSDNMISENNLWSMRTLHYCYHKTRCGDVNNDGTINATRLRSDPPKRTDKDTERITSFGGMFSRFLYFASNGGDTGYQNYEHNYLPGQHIDLLSHLVDEDGVPLLDCPVAGEPRNCWAHWYDQTSAFLFKSPTKVDDGYGITSYQRFFRFFDEIRRKGSVGFRPSAYRMRGNVLNGGKQSCAPGFREFFLGVFFGRRGITAYCVDGGNRCNRWRHAHAALFICIAADLPAGASPGDTMPGASFKCAAKYDHSADPTGAKIDQLLRSTDCSFPFVTSPYMPPPVVPGVLPAGAGKGVIAVDDTLDHGNPILRGGEYTVVSQASIGGVFARGNDHSINLAIQAESPAAKVYVSAGQNWLFHGLDSCPPGYKEYVLFSTQSPGVDDQEKTEWFHSASDSQGSSQVILCVLTSRSAYENAALGVKDASALLNRLPPQPFFPPNTTTVIDLNLTTPTPTTSIPPPTTASQQSTPFMSTSTPTSMDVTTTPPATDPSSPTTMSGPNP